jgi:transglutaminase-like putative cysteine protease
MRPESVSYTDPFRPLSMPFKRLYAFDRVREDFSLEVEGGALRSLPLTGEVQAHEDVFYADFQVELGMGTTVRVPSIGPGARILALATQPSTPLDLLEDSAGNWFLRSPRPGLVRVVYESAIEREVFGGVFPQVSWETLGKEGVGLPDNVRVVADRVLSHIGVQGAETPTHALRVLVDYFRRFHESDDVYLGHDPAELYLHLSLERKGVCRHRAYAFMVTALALGIPTRLVHNEAHAWVEVFGGRHFHRIDLGGAAVGVHDFRRDAAVPEHRTPPDAFSWPAGADPGSSLLADLDRTPAPASPFRLDQPATDPAHLEEKVEITVTTHQKEILRGAPLTVSGRATKQGRPCAHSRIDLVLASGSEEQAIGSVATNRDGDFLGHVTVPLDRAVGTYELVARLGAGCD